MKKVSIRQKMALMLFGFCLSMPLLEMGLCLSGYVFVVTNFKLLADESYAFENKRYLYKFFNVIDRVKY